MKPYKILLLFIASNEFYYAFAINPPNKSFKDKSKRVDQFWLPRTSQSHRGYYSTRRPGNSYKPYSRVAYDDYSYYNSYVPVPMPTEATPSPPAMSTTTTAPSNSTEEKPKKLLVPQINFYNSVPNSVGVIAQGLLWLREVANAIGTPLPLWVGSIPLVLIGIGLMFLPDLTTLGLPLFYPAGAGGDLLAAFPPIPEITIPDVGSSDFLKQAVQLLPLKVISMRKG